MYGYFTHGTDPPPRPSSSGFFFLPDRLRRLPSPAHFRRRFLGHATFAALVVLHRRPSTDRASRATSLSCPFRLLHTFLSLRPARRYPRFRIRRSSSERQRDFNPPEQRAAQHTLRHSPTSPERSRPPFGLSPSRTGLALLAKTPRRSL